MKSKYDSERAKDEIEKLRKEILKHDYLYYVVGEPEISDEEYDRLFKRLKELEQAFPEYITEDSPTQRVGGSPIKGFETVKHTSPMLSLDNTYSKEELIAFLNRVEKNEQNVSYYLQLKVDGVALAVIYRDGKFLKAITRGNGIEGDDVSENVKTIKAIPMNLYTNKKDIANIEVRGEVFIRKSVFTALNKKREEEGLNLFSNPRNTAAGSLKLMDSKEVSKRQLSFFIHTVPYPVENLTMLSEIDELLKQYKLPVLPHTRLCKERECIFTYIDYWEQQREKLDFIIDGIVIKVNDINIQKRLGQTLHSPRWAVAYKYASIKKETLVKNIVVNVGRTGVLTPVAILEPKELSGTIVKRATLHNLDEIRKKDIRIGDYVIIEKGGEIIPKIVKVVKEKRKDTKVFNMPAKCPVCSGKIVHLSGEVAYRCININCPSQVKARILHYASREAMNIKGMGEVMVEKLFNASLVKTIPDMYELTEERLLSLERMGKKSAENLINAIAMSKQRRFYRLLYGLGIRYVGIKASEILEEHFLSIENLSKATKEQLSKIEGIGEVTAESIVNFFSEKHNIEMLNALKSYGLSMVYKGDKKKSSAFKGMKFVFTGTLSSFKRETAKKLVRERGGEVVSSVSKNVTYVVVGASSGSKFEKAKKLGVKCIDEETFKRLLEKA